MLKIRKKQKNPIKEPENIIKSIIENTDDDETLRDIVLDLDTRKTFKLMATEKINDENVLLDIFSYAGLMNMPSVRNLALQKLIAIKSDKITDKVLLAEIKSGHILENELAKTIIGSIKDEKVLCEIGMSWYASEAIVKLVVERMKSDFDLACIACHTSYDEIIIYIINKIQSESDLFHIMVERRNKEMVVNMIFDRITSEKKFYYIARNGNFTQKIRDEAIAKITSEEYLVKLILDITWKFGTEERLKMIQRIKSKENLECIYKKSSNILIKEYARQRLNKIM